MDNRDQHLHTTYNTLSVEEWENTYGKNYRRLFEKGATTVMVGHIGLPEYVKDNQSTGNEKRDSGTRFSVKRNCDGTFKENAWDSME